MLGVVPEAAVVVKGRSEEAPDVAVKGRCPVDGRRLRCKLPVLGSRCELRWTLAGAVCGGAPHDVAKFSPSMRSAACTSCGGAPSLRSLSRCGGALCKRSLARSVISTPCLQMKPRRQCDLDKHEGGAEAVQCAWCRPGRDVTESRWMPSRIWLISSKTLA